MGWYAALGLALIGAELADPALAPHAGTAGFDADAVPPARPALGGGAAVEQPAQQACRDLGKPGRPGTPAEQDRPRPVTKPPEPGQVAGAPTPGGPPTPRQVAEALTAAGWDRQRLADLVRERQTAEVPWPFPVAAEQRPGIGAAQFVSVLRQVTDHLDVHSWQHTGPAPDRPLTADERRLLADVPPHWS